MATYPSIQAVDAFHMDPATSLTLLHAHANPKAIEQYSIDQCSELFNEQGNHNWNPVTYNQISASQKTDAHLKVFCISTIVANPPPPTTFHRKGKPYQLWTFKDKIYIPQEMQHKVVQWYHNRLLHPGHTRTERTIDQHFWWPKMRKQIRQHV